MAALTGGPPGSPLGARGVHVDYPGAKGVLRNVDVWLDPGARLALLGANGSGKSTLLRCLSGALRPVAGEVVADGLPLEYSRHGLTAHRQHVQLVLQDPDDQLFTSDVFQDVSFGPVNLGLDDAEVTRRVREALAALEITDLVDKPVHHLSFGQRKRVALAGALSMRPSVLLLDEPTAGLDPQGVRALLGSLASLERFGTTVAMSTHDVELAWRWADTVGVLVDHELRQGDPGVLLRDPELLSAAGLEPPWQARLMDEAGAELDAGVPHPREPGEVLALLRRRWGPPWPGTA